MTEYAISEPVVEHPVRPIVLNMDVKVTARIDSNNGATNEQMREGLEADLRRFYEWQFPPGVDGVVTAHIETNVKVEDA